MGNYYKKYPDKVKALNKKYREDHPEECKRWSRESYHRRKNDPEKIPYFLWKNARERALSKGLDFTISKEDIIIPEACPILGVKFDKSSRRYSYSLDKIDPTRGYTPDNVWVISQLANAMKWDSTREERIAFAKWVLAGEGGRYPCS